ncbi:MAG: hypothetical protein WA240_13110 [Nitrospirota bacterium]
MTTFICKIPPNLPFPKGGISPSLEKRGEGRFLNYVFSIMRPLIIVIPAHPVSKYGVNSSGYPAKSIDSR